ncbi:unnamed protein product [Prunus armeniaca]|uniref:Uncharacterized protein n=1 Tax=Prunus armeniaca TaxID=36596 RepID=A0A6J5WD41_PRUAR|nr:unnamed protein product [Prunus armeniaca]
MRLLLISHYVCRYVDESYVASSQTLHGSNDQPASANLVYTAWFKADQLVMTIGQLVTNNDLVTTVFLRLGSDYAKLIIVILKFPHMPLFKDLHAYVIFLSLKPFDLPHLLLMHSPSPTFFFFFFFFFCGSSFSFCPNSLHLIMVVVLLATLDVVLVAFNRSLGSFPSRIECLVMMVLMLHFLMDFLDMFGGPFVTLLVIMSLCVIIDSLLHILILLGCISLTLLPHIHLLALMSGILILAPPTI